MKKTFFALFLFLQGCLAATVPMGANKDAGSDVEKSAATDIFISAPPSVGTTPAETPAAPPAEPPAPPPVTPYLRSLPDGAPSARDNLLGDHQAMAYMSPGPLDPKTDQGQAEGLPCTTHHLKYGTDFSSTVMCFGQTPILLSGSESSLSFTFRMEKDQSGGQGDTRLWVPEDGGFQVRLVFQPLGKETWESSYVDVISDSSPEDGNVTFSGIPASAGSISLYYFEKKDQTSADFHPGGLQPFADEAAYAAFLSQPPGAEFILVGHLQVMLEFIPVTPEVSHIRTLPLDMTQPTERRLLYPLKRLYPPQP